MPHSGLYSCVGLELLGSIGSDLFPLMTSMKNLAQGDDSKDTYGRRPPPTPLTPPFTDLLGDRQTEQPIK